MSVKRMMALLGLKMKERAGANELGQLPTVRTDSSGLRLQKEGYPTYTLI